MFDQNKKLSEIDGGIVWEGRGRSLEAIKRGFGIRQDVKRSES